MRCVIYYSIAFRTVIVSDLQIRTLFCYSESELTALESQMDRISWDICKSFGTVCIVVSAGPTSAHTVASELRSCTCSTIAADYDSQ